MKIVKQSLKHIGHTPNALFAIESAARVCYASKLKGDPEFIRSLIRKGHETPLEFAHATFLIVTDRGIMAELTRHRMASFCVESTRYVRYEDGVEFIMPVGIPDWQTCVFESACAAAETDYLELLDAKVSPQVARDLLPTCTATRITAAANFREWRHILRLRTADGAHPKMRELAGMILEWFRANFPVVVEDI